jgi:glutamate 5-kinase
MKNISLEKSVRLVLKIGSSLLIKNNKFNKDWLETLIEDLIFFRKQKIEVIIVASGSVALGKSYLNIKKKKLKFRKNRHLPHVDK